MGLFLQMAAVAAPADAVKNVLAGLEGESAPQEIFPHPHNKTLVIFHPYAPDVDDTCKRLSANLHAPVFYLHVHDGDLWMYEFFVEGNDVDQFNTMPDYWEKISPEEMEHWRGNAATIAQHWPGISENTICRYLIYHSETRTDLGEGAYASDTCPRWDCWQISDFMAKLGVPYPEYSSNTAPKGHSSCSFAFDIDSALFLGLGCYGIYASTKLAVAFRLGGILLAVLMITTGILGFFAKKPARLAGVILMIFIGVFGGYQSIALGLDVWRVLLVLCGLGGAVYFYKSYKTFP